jgi:hypothetical protein
MAVSDYLQLAMPAINFGKGILGIGENALITDAMREQLVQRAKETELNKGSLGYEAFGLPTFSKGDRFSGGLFDLVLKDPVAFANVGSVGRVSFEKDPTQPGGYRFGDIKYDFTPDKDTGSTGNKILDFINEGGLAKKIADSNLSKTLSNLVFTPAYGDIPTKEEREGLESFNTLVSDTVMAEPYNMVSDTVRAEPYNMASDTVRAEPQIAQTEPAARNNQADILQIINQMEEEKKNYYTQPEEQPDFIDKMLSGLQRGAQYAGGANIGMGIGTLIDPSLGFISALLGGKYLGGADTSMTPTDRYNLSTYGGYGNMGVQDKYGINTVSLFGDYNKYVQNWNQKYGNRVYNTPYMQAKQAEMARREREQNANIEKQFADIRQQSESSGGYNPSTGYTAETASGLSGTGGSHHGYSTDYSSPF